MRGSIARQNCKYLDSCTAKGNGHCRSCNLASLHKSEQFKARLKSARYEMMTCTDYLERASSAMAERNADPGFRSAIAKGIKDAMAKRRNRLRKLVPAWVPQEMVSGYIDKIKKSGQEAAARWARAAKANQVRP